MSRNINGLNQLALKNFQVGAVIYKFCSFTNPPKNKFMVVASIQPRLLVLMINSSINSFYYSNGTDKFHVLIPAASHDFLNHNSFANCIEAFETFDFTSIQQELTSDYKNIFKGWLTNDCLMKVYDAVKDNNVMRTGHQKEIIASISKQLNF